MLQIPIREVAESVDPILKLLRSRPDEIFKRPFAGYALCLFGAPDEGVANWFARTLISVDSLTGEDIACLVFAGKTKLRGTIGHDLGFEPSKNTTGEFYLENVRQIIRDSEYHVSALVEDATSLWRQSDQDLTVVTYAVDRIASELNVTDKVPCIVFFDAVLSADPSLHDIKSRPIAVFPLRDNPRGEAIRFLRRVLHRLRNSDGFVDYLSDLRDFVDVEKVLRDTSSRAPSTKKEIASLIEDRQASLERLTSCGIQLYKVASEASMKGLRQIFGKTPELDSALLGRIESGLAPFKEELTRLSKTIGSLEYYLEFEPWPLSETSRNRLRVVVERHVRRWIADLRSIPILESRTSCGQVVATLKQRQEKIVSAFLRNGPNFEEVEITVSRVFELRLATLYSELEGLQGRNTSLRDRLEELRARCTNPEAPSMVQAVLEELRVPMDLSAPGDGDEGVKAITVVMMPNSVAGDAYIVKQAGAVGPGANASHMTFITGESGVRSEDQKKQSEGWWRLPG